MPSIVTEENIRKIIESNKQWDQKIDLFDLRRKMTGGYGYDFSQLYNYKPVQESIGKRYKGLDDGSIGMLYLNGQQLEEYGRSHQSTGEMLENTIKGFGANTLAGILGFVDGTYKMVSMFSDKADKWESTLNDWVKGLQDYTYESLPLYGSSEFGWKNGAYWLNHISQLGMVTGIVAMSALEAAILSIIMPTALPAAAVKNLGMLARLKNLTVATSRYAAFTVMPAIANVNMNATETYNDTYKALTQQHGMSHEQAQREASKAANIDMLIEVIPTILLGNYVTRGVVNRIKTWKVGGKYIGYTGKNYDISQATLPTRYERFMQTRLGKIYGSRGARYLGGILREGMQEMAENYSQQTGQTQVMLDNMFIGDTNIDWHQLRDEGIGGALGGALLGGFGKSKRAMQQVINSQNNTEMVTAKGNMLAPVRNDGPPKEGGIVPTQPPAPATPPAGPLQPISATPAPVTPAPTTPAPNGGEEHMGFHFGFDNNDDEDDDDGNDKGGKGKKVGDTPPPSPPPTAPNEVVTPKEGETKKKEPSPKEKETPPKEGEATPKKGSPPTGGIGSDAGGVGAVAKNNSEVKTDTQLQTLSKSSKHMINDIKMDIVDISFSATLAEKNKQDKNNAAAITSERKTLRKDGKVDKNNNITSVGGNTKKHVTVKDGQLIIDKKDNKDGLPTDCR